MFGPTQPVPPKDPNGCENPDKRPLPYGWYADYSADFESWIYVRFMPFPPKISRRHPADIPPAVLESKETPKPNQETVLLASDGSLSSPEIKELKHPGSAFHTSGTASECSSSHSINARSLTAEISPLSVQRSQPSKSGLAPPQDHPVSQLSPHPCGGKGEEGTHFSPITKPHSAPNTSSTAGYHPPPLGPSPKQPNQPGGAPPLQSYSIPGPGLPQLPGLTKAGSGGINILKKLEDSTLGIASIQDANIAASFFGGIAAGGLANGTAGLTGGLGVSAASRIGYPSVPHPSLGPAGGYTNAYQNQAFSLIQASMQRQQHQIENMLTTAQAQQKDAMSKHNAAFETLVAAQRQQQQATMDALAAIGKGAAGHAGPQGGKTNTSNLRLGLY